MSLFGRAAILGRQPGGGGGPSGALPAAVLALSPLSYWTLRNNDADTLTDFGSLTHDLGNTNITLNDEAGDDGYNYPDPIVGGGNGDLHAVDDLAYEPQTASGLTVMFMYKRLSVASGIQPIIAKTPTGNTGSWLISIQNSSGLIRVATFPTRQSQHTTALSGVTTWSHLFVRFSGSATGFHGVRLNGTNLTMSNSGSGTATSNSAAAVSLFSRESAAEIGQGSLAHVAIFAGNLSDGDCGTLESAATTDGW